MRSRPILASLVLLALVVGSLMVSVTVAAHSASTDDMVATQSANEHGKRGQQLARARRATAKYQDIRVALAEGYVQTSDCVGTPTSAMGWHFVKPRLVDADIQLREPEALVYHKDAYGYKLVAIEYIAPDLGQPTPRLFGRRFDGPDPINGPDQPALYTLHAWLFEHNPDGVNAPFNPRLRCPATASANH